MRDFSPEVVPNENEVADVRKVDWHALERLFSDRDVKFSPWFRLVYESGWLLRWFKSLETKADVHDFSRIYKLN